MNNKLIYLEDNEAASYKTDIKGWVSRNGRFYGEEEYFARLDGCTARHCEKCGKTTQNKSYLLCEECREKNNHEIYNKMPEKDYEEGMVLYSNVYDFYFYDNEEINDFIYTINTETNKKISITDMDLIICDANYCPEIDYEALCDDKISMDENYDCIPRQVLDAVKECNDIIRKCKTVLSYEPGKFRLNTKSF